MGEITFKNAQCWGGLMLLMAVVLVADIMFPLGVAGGVPYVVPTILSLWICGNRGIIVVAIGATGLTALGFLLSSPGSELWVVFLNRSYALVAIWAVALIGYQNEKAERALKDSNAELEAGATFKNPRI